MVKSFVVGIFPRPPKLINIWKAYERGEVDKEELDVVYREHIKNIVDLYVENKLFIVHDPQSNWHDHFRPFTSFDGIEPGPLTRFYENNTFFKRPIFNDIPRFSEDILHNYISRNIDGRVDGISIPGPHMWITHSIFKGVDNVKTITTMLLDIVKYLIDIGYRWIFLHEPSIVYYKPDRYMVEKLYENLKIYRQNLVIHTYFGGVGDALVRLGEMGFRYSIDMRWNSLNDIEYGEPPPILGVIDGQNTLMEDPSNIARIIYDKFGEVDIWISNNVDLDYLPYEYALKKVEIIAGLRGG